MQAYRLEAILQEDGTLTLEHLPFRAGERVEVIVLEQRKDEAAAGYPLHGLHVVYQEPTESIDMSDDAAAFRVR